MEKDAPVCCGQAAMASHRSVRARLRSQFWVNSSLTSERLEEHMKPISILEIAAILGAGCVGGASFACSSFVIPAIERLDSASGMLAMRQINASMFGSGFMVVLMGTGVLMMALLYFEPSLKGAAGRCIVVACVIYLVGAIVVTTLADAPLNVRLQKSEIADIRRWKSYVCDWTAWNSIRGIAATVSSAMLMLALPLRKSPLRP